MSRLNEQRYQSRDVKKTKSTNKRMQKPFMDCLFPAEFEGKVLLLSPVPHIRERNYPCTLHFESQFWGFFSPVIDICTKTEINFSLNLGGFSSTSPRQIEESTPPQQSASKQEL